MHRASDRVVNDETVCEQSMIMGARSADGEVILSGCHQNRVFVTDASAHDLAVLEIVNGNAFPEVYAIGLLHTWPSGSWRLSSSLAFRGWASSIEIAKLSVL